jgi:hypothetical protein
VRARRGASGREDDDSGHGAVDRVLGRRGGAAGGPSAEVSFDPACCT